MGKLTKEIHLDDQVGFVLEKNPDFPPMYKTDLIQLIGKKRREQKDDIRKEDKKEQAAIKFMNTQINEANFTELNQEVTNTQFGIYYQQITKFVDNLNEDNLSEDEIYVILTSYQAIGGKISRRDKKVTALPKFFREYEEKINGEEKITEEDTQRMKELYELFENRKQQAILEITSKDGRDGKTPFKGITI